MLPATGNEYLASVIREAGFPILNWLLRMLSIPLCVMLTLYGIKRGMQIGMRFGK